MLRSEHAAGLAGRELREPLAGLFGEGFTEEVGLELDLESESCCGCGRRRGGHFFFLCIWHQ